MRKSNRPRIGISTSGAVLVSRAVGKSLRLDAHEADLAAEPRQLPGQQVLHALGARVVLAVHEVQHVDRLAGRWRGSVIFVICARIETEWGFDRHERQHGCVFELCACVIERGSGRHG